MSRTIKPIAVAALATLIVGSYFGVASPASAANPQITVDLSSTTGDIKHGATGFLYGLNNDGVPSDAVISGLGPLGVAAQNAPDGLQHPTGDALKIAPQWKRLGGGDIQIYMQDIYKGWPYPNLGLADYLPKVDEIVAKVVADPHRTSYVYVPFNEPNDIWYSGNLTGLQDDWKTVYQRIRAQDPTARIAGPNFSRYDGDAYRSFMTFAKANDVLPDVTTWHELFDDFFSQWYDHYDDYRKIETDLGISPRPISINEYGRWGGDLGVPGNLVKWMARFENSKVDASLAYWQPAGTLDELVTQNNRATGAWWLYHWYGLMSAQTVDVTLPDKQQSTQAIASYDPARKQARVLLGGYDDVNGTFATDVAVEGLSGTPFTTGARVTVYGVDQSGSNPSSGPYILQDSTITVTDGEIRIPLTGLKGASAYYAVISPSDTADATTQNRYEAENARVSDGAQNAYTATGHSGAGYVEGFGPSDKAKSTFYVTAPDNGYYDLAVRYSAGPVTGAPASRSLALTINREAAATVLFAATANGNTWSTATTRVYLPAGISQLDLSAFAADNRDAVDLDYIELTPNADSPALYEGEAPDSIRAGTAFAANDSAASGGVVIGNIGNGADNTLTFSNVTATEAGDYTLTFGYAQNEFADGNGFQIVDRFADISVNGGTARKVPFPSTRGWSTFWSTSIRVHLEAGANTVKVSNATAYAPNIDYLKAGRTAAMSAPPATELNVDMTAGTRCVAGKNQLTVTAKNGEQSPLSVSYETGYGSKSFAAVQPGKTAFHAFTTRRAQLPAGQVTITATAQLNGAPVTTTKVVSYPARTCG